ncbi:winged helix-turn-helix transcriptional regulator [Hydrogenobaculum acidophilum]
MSEECPVNITLNILNGKWKLLIIKELLTGKKRFSELKKAMPEVTQKMLTKQLRELEFYGLIERKVYTEIPPKVEYSLTPLGESLKPVLDILHRWGENYIKNHKTSKDF